MNEDLPSISDFIEDISQHPSIQEEVESDLPSVEEFIEEETVESVSSDEIVNLIEQVRNEIPEVKSYDKELYDVMCLIEELRKDIPEIPEAPEVRYYDDQITELQETIVNVQDSIPTVPEVRYYEDEIENLKESIQEVKDRDIPDFRWIGNTFNTIDDNFDTLNSSLATLKGKLDLEVDNLVESLETSKFEKGVDVKRLDENISSTKEEILQKIFETKEKIYERMKETSLRVWNLNKEYKKEDKELKKEIVEEYKKLKVDLEKSIQESDYRIDLVSDYFNSLRDEVEQLPEVKYYDEEIEQVNASIKSVKNLVEVLENKLNKKIAGLKESILVVPPTENNKDVLTPLDQNFATLDDLSNHYRLFINRIQQQLSTIGGGGETRLEFLDDVDRDSVKVDGKYLQYQASTGKFIGADASGGGGSGVTTAVVRDAIQGYYGYTTDYYTVGVANTTQEIGAGTTTMIMPQVASDGINQYMPTIMSGVNTNPYVGSGATVGTGQTEFSLAGLSSGASCIVRTALAFNPDDDNSNLDVQLKFTTNTATQGTGLTNFTIKKEQALIMNEGADQQYISENLFSFFVGTTLEGTTHSNAGSFSIEVIPSAEGELEVLAVTVNVTA